MPRPQIRAEIELIDNMLAMLPNGEGEVFERLAEGASIKDLRAWLGNVGTEGLYGWRNKSEDRKARWEQAQKFSADYYAAEGMRIIDQAPNTNEGIRKAEARARYRQWMAGTRDPDKYGKKPDTLQVSFGGLFLEALREAQNENDQLQADHVADAEFEIVPEPAALPAPRAKVNALL